MKDNKTLLDKRMLKDKWLEEVTILILTWSSTNYITIYHFRAFIYVILS